MPLFHADHSAGYDLEYELPFVLVGGVRCDEGSQVPLADYSSRIEGTAAERRAMRIKLESDEPWRMQFGNRSEADFPAGVIDASI